MTEDGLVQITMEELCKGLIVYPFNFRLREVNGFEDTESTNIHIHILLDAPDNNLHQIASSFSMGSLDQNASIFRDLISRWLKQNLSDLSLQHPVWINWEDPIHLTARNAGLFNQLFIQSYNRSITGPNLTTISLTLEGLDIDPITVNTEISTELCVPTTENLTLLLGILDLAIKTELS